MGLLVLRSTVQSRCSDWFLNSCCLDRKRPSKGGHLLPNHCFATLNVSDHLVSRTSQLGTDPSSLTAMPFCSKGDLMQGQLYLGMGAVVISRKHCAPVCFNQCKFSPLLTDCCVMRLLSPIAAPNEQAGRITCHLLSWQSALPKQWLQFMPQPLRQCNMRHSIYPFLQPSDFHSLICHFAYVPIQTREEPMPSQHEQNNPLPNFDLSSTLTHLVTA